MKKISLTALAVAMALTGCGSDSSSSDTSTQNSTYTVTAIDGYLYNAVVKGGEDCTVTLGTTDEQGQLVIDSEYQSQAICIEAVVGQTIDQTRGPVDKAFELTAPAGYEIASPITNLVFEQIEQGVSEQEARENVLESLADVYSDSEEASDLIFGDFISDNSEISDAIELIAETLVDSDKNNNNLTIAEKLTVTKELSEDVAQEISDNGSIPEGFTPVINVDETGAVSSDINHKPVLSEAYSAPSDESTSYIIYEDAIELTPISVDGWFTDSDGDILTYEIQTFLNGEIYSDISLNESAEITGTINQAGTYNVYVFANDGISRSNPVNFEITVTADNKAPEVNQDEADDIQAGLNDLEVHANESVDFEFSVSTLFTDSDELSFTVSHDTNATITVEDESVLISGVFNESDMGDNEISVSATDGVNAPVVYEFTLNVQEALVTNTAPTVVNSEKETIQSEIDGWTLEQGKEVSDTIDLSNLFSDEDGDSLTYEATISFSNAAGNFALNVTDAVLSFSGTLPVASSARVETITLTATDGKEESESVIFYLPEITAAEEESSPNTAVNFLIDSSLPEYMGSMNEALFNSDGGVESFDASYQYNTDGVWIDGNKICMVDDCSEYDEFQYIGQSNNLAVASTVTDHKDLIIWSHDDLNHDADPMTVPEALKSGVWYQLFDDAGSFESTPDMLIITYDFDANTYTEGEDTPVALSVTYDNELITLTEADSMPIEECRVLSVESDLIALSCEWEHDGGQGIKHGYRLMSQDLELLENLASSTE